MLSTRSLIALTAALVAPAAAVAQGDSTHKTDTTHKAAPVGPAVRRISTASALSTADLGGINNVVELKDGRVLVNDGTRRRLLLMDTTLNVVEVVLDSLAEVANTYGTRAGMMIPYRADSILFVDPASYAALVLDPSARIARVRSAWNPDDIFSYTNASGTFGWPATDGRGRVVYRISARPGPPKVAPPPGVPYFPSPPDTAFIVALDLDTRKLDTLGAVKIPKVDYQIHMSAEGFLSISVMNNPLPTTDEWAVMPSGAVAFLRGRDYRIDYKQPDGSWTSSPKIPFDWQRLNDVDKQKFVDSVKDANRRSQMGAYVSAMIRWTNLYNKPYPKDLKIPAGFVPQNGLARSWKLPPDMTLPANYIYACAPGEEAKIIASAPAPGATGAPGGASASPADRDRAAALGGAARAAAPGPPPTPGGAAVSGSTALPTGMTVTPGGPLIGGAPVPVGGTPSCIPSPIVVSGGVAPPMPTIRELFVVPPDELPDYRPPFIAGAARADADGNLWVRTQPAKPVPGGPIYDVINKEGELVDRLQVPVGYTLVGFGKGKVVYLSMRDPKGIHLARVRLR
ncbi:MAG TPA: hypothetical protein VGQ44_06140 [Gemmatimonadaceae bacterium]|jgi:hypothetical protein|nr:hypothetical protein [Gemmatimonadaceae bacterium]